MPDSVASMIDVPFHQDSRVVRGFIRFSRSIAVLMIATAVIVLLGWWWDAQSQTAAVSEQRSMKVNAAIGFVLSGTALLLSHGPGRLRSRIGPWLSIFVAGIGLATLTEYVWSLDLGIDHLFDDPLAHRSDPLSGRMAELIAMSFVLLGGLGLLVSTRRWLQLREGLALALLAIATTGLVSCGLALAGGDGGPFSRVPIYTPILLLLATLGWMSSTATIGFIRVATADTLGGVFARRLLLPALFLPMVVAFVFEELQSRLGLSEALAFSLVALSSCGAVAWLVWWAANLLDRLERQRRETVLLRNEADTDILTGLANRRAFDDALANLLRGQREHDATFALLMLDLDRFKGYNDDFGHLAGDEVLRITGHLLGAALRPSDLAARYGGEEFALLLPDTDRLQGSEVAARILEAFRCFGWPHRPVTISIGVAQSTTNDAAADLIQRADTALYDAKHAGRNQAVVATSAR